MSDTPIEAPADDSQPVTATEQSETAPEVVNDPNAPRDVAPADVDDPLAQPPTGEEIAAARQAEDSNDHSDVNQLGDQDAVNLGYNYPPGAEVPTAQNVRRYPELFTQEVIDSFNVPDPNVPVE